MPTPAEIRNARLEAGLSQREVAALMHLSTDTVRFWEAGRSRLKPDRWELLQQKLAGESAETAVRRRVADAVRAMQAQASAPPPAAEFPNVEADRHADYSSLCRAVLASMDPRPTIDQLCDWTGLREHALRSWLRAPTSKAHRPMPRYALRLIAYELGTRLPDTDYGVLLAVTQ